MLWTIVSLVEHIIVVIALAVFIPLVLKKGLKEVLFGAVISAAQKTSFGKNLIAKETEESAAAIKKLVVKTQELDDTSKFMRIPEIGVDADTILEQVRTLRGKEAAYNSGNAFGGIYSNSKKVKQLYVEAGNIFSDSNGLYPMLFVGLLKFEKEVISMTLNLLEAPSTGCATMTTGGTESILMAVKAYRERGADLYGITEPEMIVPVSAHAAFCKGAKYFGVKFVCVPVRDDFRADAEVIQKAITPNTIMIVASSPSYPQGVIDDIEAIGQVALERDIPFHVDSCLGGFCLPFLTKLGHVSKPWNFKVPGVTSMSADIHKYGFGPKGSSVISYVSHEYRKYQFFTTAHWSGGLYASPTMTGSRPGSTIAASWAHMIHMGEDKFLEFNSEAYQVFEMLCDGISQIPELFILGPPDACCIAFDSNDFDILSLADVMEERGWKNLNRLQRPNCIQIQVGFRTDFNHEQFLEDLTECSSLLKGGQKAEEGMASVYGLAGQIPSESGIVDEILLGYLDAVY
eukprot:TRINITY_DN11210_c0_g1_i1.p1 TRINITY_DN11210_c0_g1~~TRINITY_DN11210_c0_g1_i1.p1  ORF type:complete len:516 (+),score=128.11 TRINITY_DN11210_c0_g1_i1:31-1578(+)